MSNDTNFTIQDVLDQPYKYGFSTKIDKEYFPFGLNEDIVSQISFIKNEPTFLLKFRNRSYQSWRKMKFPKWANLPDLKIDFEKIKYYSIPKKKKKTNFFFR